MEFAEVGEYVKAASKDHTLALMPIPMVADLFDITGAGVSARVRNGSLKDIRVGGSRYILLESVFDTLSKFEKDVETVRRYLEAQARMGVASVEYGPVMSLVGMSPGISADRTKIGRILGAVSVGTIRDGKGLLTAIVHLKGTKMPSEKGFFDLVDSLVGQGKIAPWQSKHKTRAEFVAAEIRRVLRSYKK
jgi:hypothetical protein